MKMLKASLILFMLMLVTVGCSKQTPEELLASAKQNIEQGKLQSAIVELKSAISQNNSLSEARTLLGRVYLQQSQFEAAEKELLRGADMGAPYADVYPYLVKVYYYQEDFEGVISLADRIMLVLDDEVKPSLALYQYLAQLRLPGQGVNQVTFPEILQGDRRKLAEAYKAYLLQNVEEAKTIADGFNADSTDKVEQFFLLGLINNRLGDLESAAASFDGVLKEYPNYHLVRFLLIDVLMRNESLDKAEVQVDKLLAINKEQPQANYYKGAIAFQKEDFENAFFYAEKAREGRSEGLRNDMVHGMSAYKLGKLERAYSSLRRAASKLPKTHSVHRLVAQLQLDLGYSREAAKTLDSLEGITDVDALLFEQAASLFASESDFEMAAQQFSKMNTFENSDAVAELGEGISKIAANDLSGVKNIQESLVMDPSNDQAWLFLAEVYMQEGQQENALKLSQEWQKVNQLGGLVLEGQIRSKLNQNPEAITAFESALAIDENYTPALNNLIKTLRLSGNTEKAKETAYGVLEANPLNKYAAKELILIAEKEDNYEETASFFESIVEQNGESEEPVLMLATLKRVSGDNAGAIDILEKNRSLLSIYGLESLGDAYYNNRQFDKAESVYIEWRDRTPDVATPWFRLVGLYGISGEIDKAKTTVDAAVGKFPNSEPLRLAKLKFLMQGKEYAAARQELEFLKKSTSTNLTLAKFEGQLALIDGEYAKAEPMLEQYYKVTDEFDDAINLSIAYAGNNKKTKAKELFERHLEKQPDSMVVKVKSAEFMSTHGFDKEAIALYTQISELLPDSPIGYNNLSGAYLRSGQFDQALAAAEKAIKIAPEVPQVMDTYGYALFKNGDALEAKSILAIAHDKLPTDPGVALNYAEVLIELGEATQASSVLRTVRAVTNNQQTRLEVLKQASRN